MYRLLRQFVTDPKHRRVLRHLFGVPAHEVHPSDFSAALQRGEIPEDLEEMEQVTPIVPLFFQEGSRVLGVKILAAYIFGSRFPFLTEGLFGRKIRTSSPYRDPYMGSYVSKEALRSAVTEVTQGTNTGTNAAALKEFDRLNRRDGTVESPKPIPLELAGYIDDLKLDETGQIVISIVSRPDVVATLPEDVKRRIRRNITLLRTAAPLVRVNTLL